MVEFEGQGAARKPLAITGASRDLTERRHAEELQRLLTNELNHRVKNTLATVQSIVNQTLRTAADAEMALSMVNARIVALAGAHDLLTERNWAGADLGDVVRRAIAPFAAGWIVLNGPPVKLSPSQTLALSLALHELATKQNTARFRGRKAGLLLNGK